MAGVLMKKGNLDKETDTHRKTCTQGECHMKIEVILPRAKGLPETRKEA